MVNKREENETTRSSNGKIRTQYRVKQNAQPVALALPRANERITET